MTTITSIEQDFEVTTELPVQNSPRFFTDVTIQRLWRGFVMCFSASAATACAFLAFIEPVCIVGAVGFGFITHLFYKSLTNLHDCQLPLPKGRSLKGD